MEIANVSGLLIEVKPLFGLLQSFAKKHQLISPTLSRLEWLEAMFFPNLNSLLIFPLEYPNDTKRHYDRTRP
jgi:hypothetical protein